MDCNRSVALIQIGTFGDRMGSSFILATAVATSVLWNAECPS
jgi:hypothetical protein